MYAASDKSPDGTSDQRLRARRAWPPDRRDGEAGRPESRHRHRQPLRSGDGRGLRIDYTPATQGATVSDLRLQSAWVARIQYWLAEHVSPGTGETIGKLLPDETIATGITVDIFNGLTASAAGIGIVTRRDFDIAGRLRGLHIDRVGEFGYRHHRLRRQRGPHDRIQSCME